MADSEESDVIPTGFLPFALTAQEVVSVFCAIYSYWRGEMDLATFYLGMAGVLLVCLGAYFIFNRENVSRFVLTLTLIAGYFYLLGGASDVTGLMWCLTILPVIIGSYGHRYGAMILVALFILSVLFVSGFGLPLEAPDYDLATCVRFLSAFLIISTFSVGMDITRVRGLDEFHDLSLRVDRIAHQDQLTQLPNRHDMERRLENKYQNYRLSGEPFAVLLADLDNFKFINDRYGHDTGDDVLHAVADALAAPLRGEDIVARWGGNEFMILLPTATSKSAVDIAERLRKAVANLEMEALGDQLRISLSMGVASIDKCTGIDDLISTAENGLYQAKHMGRDMVVVS